MLRTVFRTYSSAEAAVVSSRLSAAGLYCHITNWHFGHIANQWQVAIGGHELQVAVSDAEFAMELCRPPFSTSADLVRLETEAAAFRRTLFRNGLPGLILSWIGGVPCPLWTRRRKWKSTTGTSQS